VNQLRMDNDILERLGHFCESSVFTSRLQEHRRPSLFLFRETKGKSEGKSDKHEEQSLEQYEAFLAHQRLVDSLLTDFAQSNGLDSGDLLGGLRDAVEGHFTVLFEDHQYLWLADLLMSWNDYHSFSSLMVLEAGAAIPMNRK
jgi:hypothetical protein